MGAIPVASKCRSCGAAIYWARMPSGKLNPIDVEFSPKGDIALRVKSDGEVLGYVVEPDKLAPPKLRLSHFVTCPNAAQHRQGKLKLP
jgi:hypothetical protein